MQAENIFPYRERVHSVTLVYVFVCYRSMESVLLQGWFYLALRNLLINTFTAIVDLSRFNNSCLKSPASTLVDLTFQSRALRSFSLNQLRNLSL